MGDFLPGCALRLVTSLCVCVCVLFLMDSNQINLSSPVDYLLRNCSLVCVDCMCGCIDLYNRNISCLSCTSSHILLLFVWMLSAGGFPTQVVICDLNRERVMRGIMLSERHDMCDCALSTLSDCGTATLMPSALSMTETQLL